jgi:hypothetical protein
LTIIGQAFGGRKHEPYTGARMACSVQGRPKEARQMKSRVKSMLITLIDIKGVVHKKKYVPTDLVVNSAYYCDVLQDCVKISP